MNWLGRDGQTTVVSLRHDQAGNHRLICRSCSTRATSMPGDSFYSLPQGMKLCHSCNTVKPLEAFLVDRTRSRERGAYCKECSQRRTVHWVKTRRESSMHERIREIVRRRRSYCKKPRDGRSAHEFTITVDDVLHSYAAQGGRCYYSGVQLAFDGERHDYLVSLDRRRNGRGYVPGNIVLCCWRVNNMKRDLDDDVFIAWCRMVAGERDAPPALPNTPPRSGHRRWRSVASALRVKLDNAKQRVKRTGSDCALTPEQLLETFHRQGGRCYYTGIGLTYDRGGDTDLSIDRVDNRRGYTPDNVVICCWRVNNKKGDPLSVNIDETLTPPEFIVEEGGESS